MGLRILPRATRHARVGRGRILAHSLHVLLHGQDGVCCFVPASTSVCRTVMTARGHHCSESLAPAPLRPGRFIWAVGCSLCLGGWLLSGNNKIGSTHFSHFRDTSAIPVLVLRLFLLVRVYMWLLEPLFLVQYALWRRACCDKHAAVTCQVNFFTSMKPLMKPKNHLEKYPRSYLLVVCHIPGI